MDSWHRKNHAHRLHWSRGGSKIDVADPPLGLPPHIQPRIRQLAQVFVWLFEVLTDPDRACWSKEHVKTVLLCVSSVLLPSTHAWNTSTTANSPPHLHSLITSLGLASLPTLRHVPNTTHHLSCLITTSTVYPEAFEVKLSSDTHGFSPGNNSPQVIFSYTLWVSVSSLQHHGNATYASSNPSQDIRNYTCLDRLVPSSFTSS